MRRAMRLANANAGLWAVGNGLVSTTLVIYLASDLGARGLAISLILAAPRFAGLLRLGVPALIHRLAHRKAVCIASFLASSALLLVVPVSSSPRLGYSIPAAMAGLIIAWSVYHLLEYIAGVALWSWLGDLTPRRVRGRLLGQRERWLVVGRIGGIVGSASLALLWRWMLPEAPRWQPHALSACAGAVLMASAVVPLVLMPAVSRAPSAVPRAPWRTVVRALGDGAYMRLLAYSCWFGLVNGITYAAQFNYPIRVLDISYAGMLTLRGTMRAGQSAIAPAVGRAVDRCGNRPVMILAQLIVATSPLFFLAATPERWWIVGGAFLAWIAYAGLNVGLDNLKLKLAPADNNAPYVAVYHAISDLANGVATIAGGFFFDRLRAGGSDAMTLYAGLFIAGWLGRTAAALFVARLIEPGALRLRDVLRHPGILSRA